MIHYNTNNELDDDDLSDLLTEYKSNFNKKTNENALIDNILNDAEYVEIDDANIEDMLSSVSKDVKQRLGSKGYDKMKGIFGNKDTHSNREYDKKKYDKKEYDDKEVVYYKSDDEEYIDNLSQLQDFCDIECEDKININDYDKIKNRLKKYQIVNDISELKNKQYIVYPVIESEVVIETETNDETGNKSKIKNIPVLKSGYFNNYKNNRINLYKHKYQWSIGGDRIIFVKKKPLS